MGKDTLIYEMPVYCGRLKEWRVLNINTGTIYTQSYPSMEEALASIEEGETRGDCHRNGGKFVVTRITKSEVLLFLNN